MTGAAVPPAASVRREVALVLAAYAVPLLLTASLLMAKAVQSDRQPLTLIVTFLLIGAVGPVAGHISKRRKAARLERQRGSPRSPVDDGTRDAVAAIAPGLSGLSMLVDGPGARLSVDGSRLLMGAAWMGPERPGSQLSDARFFALAHEERHQDVHAFGLLRWFRLIRSAQMAAATAVYVSIVLNVAAVFDDPFRVALTLSLVLLPYVTGVLSAVLDEASNALEWRLELDCDMAAARQCRDQGRAVVAHPAEPLIQNIDRADLHGPTNLRALALDGAGARRWVSAVLATGWLAMTLPLAALLAFAWAAVDNPDILELLIAGVLAASLLAAAASVIESARLGSGGAGARLKSAASMIWLRTYLFAARMLAWAVSLLASLLVANLAATVLTGRLPQVTDTAVAAAFCAAAVTYWRVSVVPIRTAWVVANCAVDALRLWLVAWFLRASGVLPFYDDLTALGAAMRGSAQIIRREMSRMWDGDRTWLLAIAVACLLGSTIVGVLTVRCYWTLDLSAAGSVGRRRPVHRQGGHSRRALPAR